MTLAILLAAALASGGSAVPNPKAAELFDADPLLRSWALARFDRNQDGWLTLFEAHDAADAFRVLADRDGDGQVTVREYRDARSYLGTRHNLESVSSLSK